MSLVFVPARVEDHRVLSNLTFRSKQHWGYPDDYMLLWKDNLTITPSYIIQNKVVKALAAGQLIGYYGLSLTDNAVYRIDHLWLEPKFIQRGYCTQLFNFIKRYLTSIGHRRAVLTADPHSLGFYQKMGGKVVHMQQSQIPGRMLPIVEFIF
jgi:RimJ/RimL family protein N-acetyltransferase